MSETPYTFGAMRAETRERPVGIGTPQRPVRPLGRVLDVLLGWIERHRQRRLLQAMSDHMLHDMGLSRADVDHEIRKHFWRV